MAGAFSSAVGGSAVIASDAPTADRLGRADRRQP